MSKILKIEDVKVITEKGVEIERYVFNDDKIVRVGAKTDRVLTKNVPKAYTDLISLYSINMMTKEEAKEEKTSKKEREKKLDLIRSGQGAGLGVLLGILLHFTVIGPIIAGFFSFAFLEDISNKEYLENTDAKEINFRKGFYAAGIFGWIVAIVCCAQWKVDMISVLEDEPTKQSLNKHVCFKVWFWVSLVLDILYWISFFANMNKTYYYTTKTTTPYYRYK